MKGKFLMLVAGVAVALAGCDKVPGVNAMIEKDDVRFASILQAMQSAKVDLDAVAAKPKLCVSEQINLTNMVLNNQARFGTISLELSQLTSNGDVVVKGMHPSSQQLADFETAYSELQSAASKAQSVAKDLTCS
jgi:hypothetical protein